MNETRQWPTGVAAMTLFVEDLPAAVSFYETVFDLEVFYRDDNSTVFKFGGTLVNLLKVSEAPELVNPAEVADRTAGHRAVYTVGVDDVDAVCARLAARGIPLLNGPMDRPWGIRTASVVDPGGHIWEFAK